MHTKDIEDRTIKTEESRKGFIHAELIIAYGKDALITKTPWRFWQSKYDGSWTDCNYHPHWDDDREYRRKPKLIFINDYEVKIGERLYYSNHLGTAFIGTVLEFDFDSEVPRIALDTVENGSITKYWVFSDSGYLSSVIKIGNYEVPAPLNSAPTADTHVYVINLTNVENCVHITYGANAQGHARLLAKGLLHLDKRAAELHAEALLSFTHI